MFHKTIPAVKVHTHVAGTVAGYTAMREAAATKPPRRTNMRDVAGCGQTPSIRDVFCPTN